jgi:hypothetical protein
MVDAFNKYFCNIGHTLASKIMNDNSTNEENLSSRINTLKGPLNSFFMAPVALAEICDCITTLKSTASAGADMVTSILLKTCKRSVAIPLAYIYNLSVECGVYPECLKHAVVIPIYKGGEKKIMSNYRPISIISTVSKVFEKIIGERMRRYLELRGFFFLQSVWVSARIGYPGSHFKINRLYNLLFRK